MPQSGAARADLEGEFQERLRAVRSPAESPWADRGPGFTGFAARPTDGVGAGVLLSAVFFARHVSGVVKVTSVVDPDGVERLYAPGELEFLQSEAYARDGIPLNGVTLADLAMTADKLGADVGAFNWLQPA